MRQLITSFLVLAVTATSALASGKFSASGLTGVGLKKPGRVVIQNDRHSIKAYQFSGDIRRLLVALKTSPVRPYSAFGAVLRQSTAPLTAPMPEHLRAIIADASRMHGVDPRLVAAVVKRESGYNVLASSPVGAQGLMQLMPSTSRWLGVTNPFDARQNVFAGTRYLRMLLDTFGGDLDLTLAAYNAGPGAVRRHRGVPPYRETIAYVAAVRGHYEQSVVAK